MVLFDRSWFNRAGVEHVIGFCNDGEYGEFLHSCPEFERMLVRSGIILVKYWFSVSDEEQEHRFQERRHDITKRWKLSAMGLQSRRRWVECSRAKRRLGCVESGRACSLSVRGGEVFPTPSFLKPWQEVVIATLGSPVSPSFFFL